MGIWKHQREAVEYARERRDVILHIGMGGGKSRCALEIVGEEIAAGRGRRVMLACPKAVIAAWQKQISLWLPTVRVLVLDKGSSADKGKRLSVALADSSPVIVISNYESWWRIKGAEAVAWDAFVLDEVHRLKSPSGAQSKWFHRQTKRLPTAKRLALSGTLLAHSPLDAWAIYRAVESPECPTFGPAYTIFKATYAITNPRIPGMVVGYRNQEQFSARIAKTTFYRRSEDVLDLPEILHVEVPVEMTPKEGHVYRQLEREFCAEVEQGKFVTPANAMVSLLRMLQSCQGFVRVDDESEARQIDASPSKRTALEEWLADIAEPLVIFCRFRSDIVTATLACHASGRTTSELSGRINQLADWQAGRTDVLIAQIQSGGIGIDLTRASVGVFYSLGHSLSEWLQAIARLHRPGQERKTRFFSFVSTLQGNRTADGRVYAALRERKDVVDELLRGYAGREHTERVVVPGRGD